MVDPDLELRRGPGVVLLAPLVFFPLSFLHFFFYQNKGGGGGGAPLDPPLTFSCFDSMLIGFLFVCRDVPFSCIYFPLFAYLRLEVCYQIYTLIR